MDILQSWNDKVKKPNWIDIIQSCNGLTYNDVSRLFFFGKNMPVVIELDGLELQMTGPQGFCYYAFRQLAGKPGAVDLNHLGGQIASLLDRYVSAVLDIPMVSWEKDSAYAVAKDITTILLSNHIIKDPHTGQEIRIKEIMPENSLPIYLIRNYNRN